MYVASELIKDGWVLLKIETDNDLGFTAIILNQPRLNVRYRLEHHGNPESLTNSPLQEFIRPRGVTYPAVSYQ